MVIFVQDLNDPLVCLAREELGPTPRRILVTGGTGFVGSHLARILSAAGHEVLLCGRNPWRWPVGRLLLPFVRADLADRQRVMELCRGCDLVYHAGALSAPWGPLQAFRRANVEGTQNIVDGCRQHGVRRLVHVSSTAIFFEFSDRWQVSDDGPLPETFCCHYAQSKAEAEDVIRRGVDAGLNAIMIRARAVFGHGDSSLLPRLITTARQGRLRQIGDGQNVIDMTYIDNLIAALLLAAERGDAGSVCTVTNGEPVVLWSVVRQLLQDLGIHQPLRTVPVSLAMLLAGALEMWHRWFDQSREPAMTRYAVGLLSRHQTFDLTAAERILNYRPLVSMQEGIRRTMADLTRRDETRADTSVDVRLFSTGFTTHRERIAEQGGRRTARLRFHAMFAVLNHPVTGLTLFDTGYAPRFFQATRRWPYCLYRWTTPVETCEQLSAREILLREGIDPSQIRRIVLSHFHADHVCGLHDFPGVDVITTRRAWDAIRGRRGLSAVTHAILPDLLPNDLEDRLQLIDHFQGPGFGPFSATHDLFGDGSVRLVDLTGHASGQCGLLVQRASDRCLLAADAAWTTRTVRERLSPTLAFRLLAASVSEVRTSLRQLHELSQQHPDVEMIPTHCPEVAERYVFDAEVDRWLSTVPHDASARRP